MTKTMIYKLLVSVVMIVAVSRGQESELRVGIIGLDTSHAMVFSKTFNLENDNPLFKGVRVTTAYQYGSLDIFSTTNRYPQYLKGVSELGVKVVDSIAELLQEVDGVLLLTNDGRRHLEQAEEVFKAGKRVFIDKPLAASLADAMRIVALSEKYKVPFFSSSSCRFAPEVQAASQGVHGKVAGIDIFAPAVLEETHPRLFWYGIHGVEKIFTIMGRGCCSVVTVKTDDTDAVIGLWEDGRVAMYRGIRGYTAKGPRHGCTVYTDTKGAVSIIHKGYEHLLVEIIKYFRTGDVPINPATTLEILAFMEASDLSIERGSVPVTMHEVMERARKQVGELRCTR